MSLVIAGHEFPLREELPKGGRFLVLFRKMRQNANDPTPLYDMAELLIEGDEATDGTSLEDAVCEVDIDELDRAIGAAMREHAGRPTQRSSDSSDGPPTTPTTSRVVSFSRGTVETVPAESSTG